jgi:hypothetical protein
MGGNPDNSPIPAPTNFLREMHKRLESLDCSTVNIEEPEPLKLKLYPNPAQNQLRWNSGNPLSQIRITHFSGLEYFFSSEELEEGILNISKLPVGVYRFQAISTEGQVMSTSFVKVR